MFQASKYLRNGESKEPSGSTARWPETASLFEGYAVSGQLVAEVPTQQEFLVSSHV